MINKSALSLAFVTALVITAQPVTSAMAEPLVLAEVGDGPLVLRRADDEPLVLRRADDQPLVLRELGRDDGVRELAEPDSEPTRTIVPETINCNQSRRLLKNAGYRKIRKKDCSRFLHVFKAKLQGRKHIVTVNAVTKSYSHN